MNPDTRIGHVHLKVSDLEISKRFYTQVLGFEVTQQEEQVVFLSAGGYHHHIALNTWQSKGEPPAPRTSPGLYHYAILYPTRKELAKAVDRLLDHGIRFGAADHGVSEAVYLNDPDGNGIELYADRPREEWPIEDGDIKMTTAPLDIEDLLQEIDGP